MAQRIVIGLLMTLALSGCFDGSDSSSTGGIPTSGSAAVPATSATVTPIVLQGTPAGSITVGVAYSYRPTVASTSGAVTFAIQNLPAWATFDASTGSLGGTPSTADVGVSGDITILASNGGDTGSVGPFVIRVVPEAASVAPDAPVISGSPAASATAGQQYSFQPSASDASGKPLTFTIVNCPAWATFSTATGQLSGTPTAAQAGAYSGISIQVTDGTLSAALPAFAINVVAPTPDMPVIGGTPSPSAMAGQPYVFQPTASDPAGKTLTFSVAQAPAWAAFDKSTGKLSGTPTVAQAGTDSDIVISVSNGTASATLAAFSINVTAPATPDSPLIGGTPAKTAVAGQAYSFAPTASDPAGRALTFSVTNRPVWANFSPTTGVLSGTPTAAQTGSYPGIVISAGNGTASAALAAFSIVVSPAAAPASPTISGSPTTSVLAGTAYSFTPAATDPNGGTLTFSVVNLPSWATFNAATGEVSGTPTAANVGTYANIGISVTDGTTKVSLPSFPIAVTQSANGSATLSWTAPTENVDGTPLNNLAGFRIYYGNSASSLTQSVQLSSPGVTTYLLTNLSPGTWYFEVRAYTAANLESSASAVASKTID